VLKTRAVSVLVQFAGGAEENAKPGREGMMTLKETGLFPTSDVVFLEEDVVFWAVGAGVVNGLTTGRNSKNDPGQPWSSSSGMAFSASADFSWMKWMSRPSIFVVKWLNLWLLFNANQFLDMGQDKWKVKQA